MTFSKDNTRFEYDVGVTEWPLKNFFLRPQAGSFLRRLEGRLRSDILQDAKTFLLLEVKTAKTYLR